MFIRIKNIKKNGNFYPYFYLVKNVWIKGKGARQQVIGYFGKVPYTEKLTKEDVRKVFEAYGIRCVMCGTKENLIIDHKIPLTKFGTNDLSNLQILCSKCNRKKGVSAQEEFETRNKHISEGGKTRAEEGA